jgi:hypothetical protein
MLTTTREVVGASYDEAATRLGCDADWLVRAAEGTIRLKGFMPGKERDFFLECTSGQLDRVGRESAKRGELLDLPTEIARRVPVPCLTPDLLASVARTCPQTPANPYDSPDQFTIGFRQEFLHAVACALAGQPNPRGEIWALYQFMVAVLAAQLPEGHVDAQLLLNERVGQLTLKFDDLWKVAWAEPLNGGRIEATADHLKLIFDMMGRLGFEGRFAVAVEAHQFVTSSQEIPPEIVIDTFSRSILSHCGFNQSLEDSRMIGHHVGLAIATFLRSSLDDVAIGLVQEMFSKAVDAGDDNAVLAIAAKSIEAFHSSATMTRGSSISSPRTARCLAVTGRRGSSSPRSPCCSIRPPQRERTSSGHRSSRSLPLLTSLTRSRCEGSG